MMISCSIFLQQDGYLDKEQILVKDLPATERPLVQKWSWDRILRSVYIKQADVLQGFTFLRRITISIPSAAIMIFMNRGRCMSRRSRPAYTPY
jgi:trehalose/maltose hydrolase-like predicted phosphorylase